MSKFNRNPEGDDVALSHFRLMAHKVQGGWDWVLIMGRWHVEGKSSHAEDVVASATAAIQEKIKGVTYTGLDRGHEAG